MAINRAPHIIPSEQRERHTFVEQSMESIHSFVAGNLAVREVLGPAIVADIESVVNDYYVPNKRNRTYTPTISQAASDRHPIIAVLPDEPHRYSPRFAEFSESQKAAVYSHLEGDMSAAEIDEFLSESRADLQSTIFGSRDLLTLKEINALLAVFALEIDVEDEENGGCVSVRSRPIQILNRSRPTDPHLHIHEFIHHWQIYNHPIVDVPDVPFGRERLKLMDEHEAYTYESGVIDAVTDTHESLGIDARLAFVAPGIIDTVLNGEPNENINPMMQFEETMLQRLREWREAGISSESFIT